MWLCSLGQTWQCRRNCWTQDSTMKCFCILAMVQECHGKGCTLFHVSKEHEVGSPCKFREPPPPTSPLLCLRHVVAEQNRPVSSCCIVSSGPQLGDFQRQGKVKPHLKIRLFCSELCSESRKIMHLFYKSSQALLYLVLNIECN